MRLIQIECNESVPKRSLYSKKLISICMLRWPRRTLPRRPRPRWGRPKAAVGRQRAAHRLRLAAAAQPRPPICLKIDSLAYEWLTRQVSRTHAQAASLSVCLCHRPHDMHRHLGTAGYNGDKIQHRNGLGFVWI